MQEQRAQVREPEQRLTEIIVVHRVQEISIGKYTGQIRLVDPETGEVMHELEPQTFNRCHEMYAAYKMLINSLRFIAGCGYSVILLDTNIKRFADEVKHQETAQALQKQLAERCVISGIDNIQVV